MKHNLCNNSSKKQEKCGTYIFDIDVCVCTRVIIVLYSYRKTKTIETFLLNEIKYLARQLSKTFSYIFKKVK